MSKLADILTGRQRRTDLAQASRIAAARTDLDQADRNRYRRPGGGDTVVHDDRLLIPGGAGLPDRNVESGVRITRAQAVLDRAQQNSTPRARSWAASLHEWGSLNAPSRRQQRRTAKVGLAPREPGSYEFRAGRWVPSAPTRGRAGRSR